MTFQSTLPVWGATQVAALILSIGDISIHAPRVGSDPPSAAPFTVARYFNPRSPCGERHENYYGDLKLSKFQSTLPVWGATVWSQPLPVVRGISIHAPRVGSDVRDALTYLQDLAFQSTLPVWGATRLFRRGLHRRGISIHAPRVGSDASDAALWVLLFAFQSTLPVWGATSSLPPAQIPRQFQSTLPVWGATNTEAREIGWSEISIHAPRVGSDCLESCESNGVQISIHAPRVGSDTSMTATTGPAWNFNPRSPCGERRWTPREVDRMKKISIHAPRVGSDAPGGCAKIRH